MPKFSIIVPCYKEVFLKECIESILFQTYQDFELILVNDASPYNIRQIVDQFKDDRIRYYEHKQGFGAKGLVQNWNDCLRYVRGEYVINMGDDDKLMPNCLSDYIDLMKKYPCLDIYHTRVAFIDEHGKTIRLQREAAEYESVYAFMWACCYGRRSTFIGDFLYRTEALRAVGGYYPLDYAWNSDRISAFVVAKEKGLANTNKIGFEFRKSRYEISNDTSSSMDKVLLWERIEDWYRSFLSESMVSGEDKAIIERLQHRLRRFIDDAIVTDIYTDLKANKWHIGVWLKLCRREQFSFRVKRRIIGKFLHCLFK